MKGFLKAFFGSLLALIVFCVLLFFFFAGLIGGLMESNEKVTVHTHSIVVLDCNTVLREQPYLNPLNAVLKKGDFKIQGLHQLVNGIHQAAVDPAIAGMYLKLNGNPNGYATSEALRRALLSFKASGKFLIAYGDVISQNDYYLASVADKIYLNPEGALDFSGFSMQMMFFKGAMDKLDIRAQVFYDGQFKSATEPFRTTEMTPANKLQTRAYLNSLYTHFLSGISQERHIDTNVLFTYADKGLVQDAADAQDYGLVDALKYPDEVQDALCRRMDRPEGSDLDFVSLSDYSQSVKPAAPGGGDKIAILYAQGDIVNEGLDGGIPQIDAERYVRLLREIRADSSVKAVVLRVNSPGGSALAADKIWREVLLTRQIKPVVVSMGDYAASGGYYIACAANRIFAEANTLTGSIGVFGIIPDLQSFFKNKLGITFDGVKTARYADMGRAVRPLTDPEKAFIQKGVDRVYRTFKSRVSQGRGLPDSTVERIAQGRVWSGADAVTLGLADSLGGMPAAVACAGNMAGLDHYTLATYPKPEMPYEEVLQSLGKWKSQLIQEQLGPYFPALRQLKALQQPSGEIMARLPFVLLSN